MEKATSFSSRGIKVHLILETFVVLFGTVLKTDRHPNVHITKYQHKQKSFTSTRLYILILRLNYIACYGKVGAKDLLSCHNVYLTMSNVVINMK